jgi:hypothetical protein
MVSESCKDALQAVDTVTVAGDGNLFVVTATAANIGTRLIYETQDREAGTEDLLGGVHVHDLDCYERVGGRGR